MKKHLKRNKQILLGQKPWKLNKKEKRWGNLDYELIVLLSENADVIINDILRITKCMMLKSKRIYVILWFFTDCAEKYYLNYFKNLDLIYNKNGCLVYDVKVFSDMDAISKSLGEWQFDNLDIIIVDETSDANNSVGYESYVYENIKKYYKNFLTWVQKADIVISDSGDAREVELIVSKKYYDQVLACVTEL